MTEAAADCALPGNGTSFEAWLHVGSAEDVSEFVAPLRIPISSFPGSATPHYLMPCTGKALNPDASSVSMPFPMGRSVAQDIHQQLLSTAGEDLIEQNGSETTIAY